MARGMNERGMIMNHIKTTTLCLLFSRALAACADDSDTRSQREIDEETTGVYVPVPEREDPPPPQTCDILPDGITEEDIQDWVAMMLPILGPEETSARICTLISTGIGEAIEHSADDIPPPEPTARWAWTKLRAHMKLPIPASAIEELGCGPSDIGEVFCAPQAIDPEESEFIIVVNVLDDTIPLGSSQYHGQYGFVFDRNGIAEDNYVADPEYPNDFYKGTDTWYQLQLYPNEGTFFGALDARNNAIQPFASAAKMIVKGATIMLVIPASEMEAECPGHRVTAFTHEGDYGLQPPYFWAGDTEPTVNEELDPACD
jgi:hypothetical protein